ncbi:MAG: sigma-70 family RNA polymerase sigma factor, partial [Gemmataceae bacterium]|nr:sigma-70 family RNA polymerase sigma factor [Gemmataceae bacterium]
ARLPDPADPPDGRLLDRFRRAGDEAAFAELVRRHGPMVLGVCRRAAGNRADADDAFQAAFLVLVRRAAELTARPTVGDFLYGVAVRTALKARATAVKRRLKEARAARPEAAPEPAGEPDVAAALDRELARLPEKYRAALVLCELEGRPRKDVAGLLGIPEGTLSSRLAAGRKLLADRLRRCGLAVPAGGLAATSTASAVPPALVETTIRAAVVTAGHAAGAVPAAAHQLAAEVTRAMFVTKLRAGVLVLTAALVGSAAGLTGLSHAVADPPAGKPAEQPTRGENLREAAAQAAKDLTGTWELQSTTTDGDTVKPGNRWEYYRITFAGQRGRLEWKSREDEPGSKAGGGDFGFSVNPTTDPPQMNWAVTETSGVVLWIYKLEGDTLTLARHSGSDLERPKGFDHKDKRLPALRLTVSVYKRVKGEEPKPAGAGTVKQLVERERAATDALKGTWELQTRTLDGTEFKLGDRKVIDGQEHRMAFEYYRLTFGDRTVKTAWKSSDKDGETHEGEHSVTLNPTADPAQINIFTKGSLLLGVYKLDGDTLTLATHGISELERPKGFDHTDKRIADLPLTVDVYKRVKKDDPKPKDEAKPAAVVPPEPALAPIGERNGDDVVGPPEDGEPDWMAGFRKGYALPDGVAVKLVAGADFPAARKDYYAKANPTFGRHGDWLQTLAADGRRLVGWNGHGAGDGTVAGMRIGIPLWHLLETLRLKPAPVLAGDPDLWGTPLYADAVVREAATLSEIARDLPAALRPLGLVVTATARPEEREVVVARGAFAPDGGEDVRVDLAPGPFGKAARGTHTYFTHHRGQLAARLGEVVGRPVIDETDPESWGRKLGGFEFVKRAEGDSRPKDLSADRDAVLKHVAAQTGLRFTTEKRTVWVLTLRRAGAADPPAAKPAPPPPALEKEKPGTVSPARPDDPTWKADFRRAYALADKQVVRLVPAPFPEVRRAYLMDADPDQLGLRPQSQHLHIRDDGRRLTWQGSHSRSVWYGDAAYTVITKEEGLTLAGWLEWAAGASPPEVEGDADLLALRADADIVVRAGAKPDELLAGLQAELREKFRLPVKLSYREVEREVIVAGGKFASKPRDGRKENDVDYFAEYLNPQEDGHANRFDLDAALTRLGRFVDRRVVNEAGKPPDGTWLAVREHNRIAPGRPGFPHPDDVDPAKVLPNVTAQTGLTFTTEKRKVRVLLVERDEK